MGNCWVYGSSELCMWTREVKDQWNWEIVNEFVKDEVSILILYISAGGNNNWVQADVVTAQKGGCASSGDSCLREMEPYFGTILTGRITEFHGAHHFLPWECCVCKIATFSSLSQCWQQTSSSLGWVVLSVNPLVDWCFDYWTSVVFTAVWLITIFVGYDIASSQNSEFLTIIC